MNVKPNTQTKHRDGTLIAFVDLIHEITDITHGDGQDLKDDVKADKFNEITGKIRSFDITTIGDLYLTSGGRIVLDKGYGEYFDAGDKKLFTLKELKSGVSPKEFRDKLDALLGDKK
jgi:hypothetical protein